MLRRIALATAVMLAMLGVAGGPVAAAPSMDDGCDRLPSIVQRAPAKNPPSAERAGKTGHTSVEVRLDADGNVLGARVVQSSGDAALDDATLAAAKASVYTPRYRDCHATAGEFIFSSLYQNGPGPIYQVSATEWFQCEDDAGTLVPMTVVKSTKDSKTIPSIRANASTLYECIAGGHNGVLRHITRPEE